MTFYVGQLLPGDGVFELSRSDIAYYGNPDDITGIVVSVGEPTYDSILGIKREVCFFTHDRGLMKVQWLNSAALIGIVIRGDVVLSGSLAERGQIDE